MEIRAAKFISLLSVHAIKRDSGSQSVGEPHGLVHCKHRDCEIQCWMLHYEALRGEEIGFVGGKIRQVQLPRKTTKLRRQKTKKKKAKKKKQRTNKKQTKNKQKSSISIQGRTSNTGVSEDTFITSVRIE